MANNRAYLVTTSARRLKDAYKDDLDCPVLSWEFRQGLIRQIKEAGPKRRQEIREALWVTSFWPKFCMRIVSCGMHSAERSGVGTWGAFVGLLIQIIAQYLLGFGLEGMIWTAVVVSVIDLIVTKPGEECMFRFYGPRKRHTGELVRYDFNQDCLDEVAGYLWTWVALMLLQRFDLIPELVWWTPALAFLAFRFFDAVKPWPIKQVEKAFRPGSAWGILLDDVAAGMIAGVLALPVAALIQWGWMKIF